MSIYASVSLSYIIFFCIDNMAVRNYTGAETRSCFMKKIITFVPLVKDTGGDE